jgi:endo-1,4-beta-xylanase
MKPRLLFSLVVLSLTHFGVQANDNTQLSLASLADFPIGAAVPADPWPNSLLQSPERQALMQQHFDSLTAENAMKMAYLQPAPGEFEFSHADALVDYAKANDIIVHGHALVWHTQTARWMDEHPGPAHEMTQIMDNHIRTVAGHYAGRVVSWDVVNEAFTDEAPSEYRETIWYNNIGPGYIERAFRLAHQAAPQAELYYNDYDISGMIGPAKLDRVLEMIDDFLARGVPIHGLGFQMHIDTEKPALEDIRESFAKAVARGIKVRISELDIAVNQSEQYQQLTPELAQLQRQRYRDVTRVYLETVPAEQRGGITLWGLTDSDSWIPGFKERADWPLLFDAEFKAKPALEGFAEGLRGSE